MALRTVALIQARMASTRLPGKVLRPLVGKPVLHHVIERVRQVPGLAEVVVATTTDPEDMAIGAACVAQVPVFHGHPTDVLSRLHAAARAFRAEAILRVTADCPCWNPSVGRAVVDAIQTEQWDYVAALAVDGWDAEALTMKALELAHQCTKVDDREHVTTYCRQHPRLFRTYHVPILNGPTEKLSVDTEEDFARVVRAVAAARRV